MTAEERGKLMIREYGEACTQAQAARILNHSPATIARMVSEGRLEAACEGTRIDVRSIAEYIKAPAQKNFEARQRKLGRRWAV